MDTRTSPGIDLDGYRFETIGGTQVDVVTAAQMRALDAAAAGYGLIRMVEHAGRHLADLCQRLGAWPGAPGVVALAGSGGNGAGVLAAARHFANAGAEVTALLTQPEGSTPAVTQQLTLLQAAGGTLLTGRAIPADADLILDGLVGYGLRGPLRGRLRLLAEEVAERANEGLVISLDVPSGLDPDTGEPTGVAILPAATLTVGLPKRGLLNPAAGDVWLADIGIPRSLFAAVHLNPPPAEVALHGLVQLRRRYRLPNERADQIATTGGRIAKFSRRCAGHRSGTGREF